MLNVENSIIPQISPKVTPVANFKSNPQSNIRKVNFKAGNDEFSVNDMYYQNVPNKKPRKQINIGAILAAVCSAVCIIYFGSFIFGKGQKEFKELSGEIKKIARSDIKRQAEEEAARQPFERSNYRIKDLITLDKLSAKQEKRELADIDAVKKYMDENIIGMEEAKKEIIAFLKEYNYNIKNGIVNDKPLVLLFDGPPGTGKTTLSKVISDALGMHYKKVPLAGAEGSGSIVGFERTYSGSKGGAIADGFLEGKTKKVFFNFDEIDKASVGRHNGNPVDPLLSLCDNQGIFVDKYYNVPLDVSQCMFCFTSNELANIPEALRSRVQLIKIKPYSNKVKSQIAKNQLLKDVEFNKLKDKIKLNDNIYDAIAEKTVDQGGRDTIKYVNAIIKKTKGLLEDGTKDITLDKNFLSDIKIESALDGVEKASRQTPPPIITPADVEAINKRTGISKERIVNWFKNLFHRNKS